jgi:hypothetical protein
MALGEVKFDEGGARKRLEQAEANRRTNRMGTITALDRCRNKATVNGVILSNTSWFDEQNEKKNFVGESAWKSVMNVGSAMREVK